MVRRKIKSETVTKNGLFFFVKTRVKDRIALDAKHITEGVGLGSCFVDLSSVNGPGRSRNERDILVDGSKTISELGQSEVKMVCNVNGLL